MYPKTVYISVLKVVLFVCFFWEEVGMNVSILGDITSSYFLGFLLLEIFEHEKIIV